MCERGQQYTNSREKRAVDIGVSCLGWIFAGPTVSALALVKYLEDRENPFYVQERIGRGGERIKIIKIRSMSNDTSISDEQRITPFGAFLRKTHLDELPQIISVMAGDLSLVGPRPSSPKAFTMMHELATEVRSMEVLNAYQSMKPGITSIHQVIIYKHHFDPKDKAYNADRGGILKRRIHADRFYQRNASLGVDLMIMCQTGKIVIDNLFGQINNQLKVKKIDVDE